MNDDLIYRQAAIDAVEHITSSMSVCVNTDECHGMKRMQRQAVIELANLPSAQPEITHCRECANCYTDKVFRMRWCNGHRVTGDDFCSRAVRRTDDLQ